MQDGLETVGLQQHMKQSTAMEADASKRRLKLQGTAALLPPYQESVQGTRNERSCTIKVR